MKSINLIFWFLIATSSIFAQPFITEWATKNANETITITVNNPNNSLVKYNVDWGDNVINTEVTGSITHMYANAGTHTVKISGDFPGIHANMPTGNALKLVKIVAWGSIQWETMESAFKGAANLNYTATVAPDLIAVKDMSSMFKGCSTFNGDIGNWNTSSVTDMSYMFYGASVFDMPLAETTGQWNTSSVTNMSHMFYQADAFNHPLNSWTTDKVIDMSLMFRGTASFDQPLNSWNTGLVTDMTAMFSGATKFNHPLDSWTTDNVTDMSYMFIDAASFDQSLNDWNVSNVQDMLDMLSSSGLSQANYDATLTGWATQAVKSGVVLAASNITYCASASKRQSLIEDHGWVILGDLGCDSAFVTTWRTTQANEEITIFTDPDYIYNFSIDWENDGIIDVISANGDISHTYPSGGDHQVAIYRRFPSFRSTNSTSSSITNDQLLSLDQWGSIVWESMNHSFSNSPNMIYAASDQPDLSMVSNFESMFYNCQSFNGDLGNWDISNATNMVNILANSGMSTVNYDNTIIGWEAFATGQGQVASGLDVGVTGLTYCLSSAERATLEAAPFNWNFDGDLLCKDAFITTWRTTQANESITIRTNSNYSYSYNIDWENDGIIDTTGVTGDATHTYDAPDDYQIAISGDFPYFLSSGGSTSPNFKLISVDQWGSIAWEGMSFAYSPVLTTTASGGPDLSMVTSLNSLFRGCSTFNGNISMWDVSSVTSMNGMFSGATQFNQDIGGWDVSNVTNMSAMFSGASSFNKNIGGWDVGKVIHMSEMFSNAVSFNAPLNSWKTDSVTMMNSMFANAASFNQPLDSLATGKVTSMGSMFANAAAFNRPITDWNTSNVTNMSHMFKGALSFNQDLNNWNTGNVIEMISMFQDAEAFNQAVDSLDVSKVESMYNMFENATAFNQSLASWDVGQVIDMFAMFKGATSFNRPLNTWDVSSVKYMDEMFLNAGQFNQPLDMWEVINVEAMNSMFKLCTNFDQNLGGWNIEMVEEMPLMFDNSGLSTANYDSTLIGWASQDVNDLVLGAQGLEYCNSAIARQSLINDHDWVFEGDSLNCTTQQPCTTVSTITYIGGTGGTWNIASNWDMGRIPDVCDEVVIPTGKMVSLSGPGHCFSIEIAAGADFQVQGHELIVWRG